jgi:hypothetical protein
MRQGEGRDDAMYTGGCGRGYAGLCMMLLHTGIFPTKGVADRPCCAST